MPGIQYKRYFVQYEEKDGKIVVSSAVADGNFICSYGGQSFDSVEDLKKYIDSGAWDVGKKKK